MYSEERNKISLCQSHTFNTICIQLYLMLRDKLWAADWILGLWILNQIMTLIYQWEKLAQKQWQILQSLPTLVSLCFNMTILWSYPKPVSLLTFVINAEGSRLRSSQLRFGGLEQIFCSKQCLPLIHMRTTLLRQPCTKDGTPDNRCWDYHSYPGSFIFWLNLLLAFVRP